MSNTDSKMICLQMSENMNELLAKTSEKESNNCIPNIKYVTWMSQHVNVKNLVEKIHSLEREHKLRVSNATSFSANIDFGKIGDHLNSYTEIYKHYIPIPSQEVILSHIDLIISSFNTNLLKNGVYSIQALYRNNMGKSIEFIYRLEMENIRSSTPELNKSQKYILDQNMMKFAVFDHDEINHVFIIVISLK